ncbi:hypothetical protein PORY_000446 [Pneumocystis oryctolagi]|uniref:Uncharacterized protein n=1 Tax=Pneumocystis oryctolagi TaxID=42067 RepID=A0ACB7CH18_9ASCO|nr:hypothetical protein PORY_000446 [Pneumocystis oryctolagi]
MPLNLSLNKSDLSFENLPSDKTTSFVHMKKKYHVNGSNEGFSKHDNEYSARNLDSLLNEDIHHDVNTNYPILSFNSEESFPSLKSSVATSTKDQKNVKNTLKDHNNKFDETHPKISSLTKTIIETLRLETNQQSSLKEFGSKSTIGEIARSIMEETNTHIDMSTARKTGITTFLIRGRPEDVHCARKMLIKELTQKITIKLSVPLNTLGSIIGTRGKVLNSIIEKSGAKIQLPKRNIAKDVSSQHPNNECKDEMVEIIITGDIEGAESAKKEIEIIVKEKTSYITLKIISINPEFYGLISGPNNSTIQKLIEGKDLKVEIPPPYSAVPDEKPKPIIISGEKNFVNSTKSDIEALYAELQHTTVQASIIVAKKLHMYLDEDLKQSILSQFQCSVIIPPPSSSSESLLIRGSPMFIGKSIQNIMDKVKSIHIDSLDITNTHLSATDKVVHARDISRYFFKKKKIAKIEKEYQIHIISPTLETLSKPNLNSVIYEFSGNNIEDVKNAKKELIKLVDSYPPYRILKLNLDPLIHCHIIGQKGRNLQKIRDQYFIDALFSDEDSFNSEIILVYEGKPGEELPHANSIQLALNNVSELLKKTAIEMSNIVSRDIHIPDKYHKYILGPKGSTLNSIIKNSNSVVKVKFSTGKKKELNGIIDENMVNVKGISLGVEYVVKEIEKIVEDLKLQESRSYSITFDFPQKFLKNLVGKGGSNIMKIKEELNVNIDFQDGNITIQGSKKNVEEAKLHIEDFVKKIEDQMVLHLSIPVKHHGSLIGQNGKFVKRLEEKYQVKINFPRENSENKNFHDKKQNIKNEVTIRGDKTGATLAKLELLDLLDYEKEHGNTTTFTIPMSTVPQIVGKSGNNINDLKDQTKTRIEIEKSTSTDPSSVATVFIQGTKEGIEEAKKSILDTVKTIQEQVTRTLFIDRKHHRALIGPGGGTLRDIIISSGAIGDRSQLSKIVQFPKTEDMSDEIIVTGNKELVDKIINNITSKVKEIEEKTTLIMSVPSSKMKIIIGKEGNMRKELEARFSVMIRIPRKFTDNPEENVEIKIIGKKEQAEKAIEEINSIVKAEECAVISVPLKSHPYILGNGTFARRMKTLHGVTLEYHDHLIPKEPNNEIKKFDTEFLNTDKFSWHIITDKDDKDISWKLRGKAEKIEQVKDIIIKMLEQMKHCTATAYLKIPSNYHGIIIGQGGSKISQIKNETGCYINIPRINSGDLITLRGTLDSLEKAKIMIMDSLNFVNKVM